MNMIRGRYALITTVLIVMNGIPGLALAATTEATSPYCAIALQEILEPFTGPLQTPEFAQAQVSADQIHKLVHVLIDPLLAQPGMTSGVIAREVLEELAHRQWDPWSTIRFWETAGAVIENSRFGNSPSTWRSTQGYDQGQGGEIFYLGSNNHVLVIATQGPHAGHIYTGLIDNEQYKGLWKKPAIIPYRSLLCRTCRSRGETVK